MLRWAREWRRRSVEDTAKRLKTKPETIRAWENGVGTPSVRQGRALARFYDRAFLEFFLEQAPQISEPAAVPDFRLRRDAKAPEQDRPEQDRDVTSIQSWAEAMRANALDLYEQIGGAPPALADGVFASVDGDPEAAASRARQLIGPEIDEQSSADGLDLPKRIRNALEASGILVLRQSGLGRLGVRGICVFFTPLPIIVYGAEAPTAQSFTMVHELGHVLLRQSAISGSLVRFDGTPAARIEDWCNRFAAAYLIPSDVLARLWNKPDIPVAVLEDNLLRRIAAAFRVSRHAALIRLVHLGYVDPEYYWGRKKAEFEREEAEYKSFGRPRYYGGRFRSTCGDLYTGLVLEAWGGGSITNHNAAELMGTKSLKHLEDIRREFMSA